jgi:hypothetical protein
LSLSARSSTYPSTAADQRTKRDFRKTYDANAAPLGKLVVAASYGVKRTVRSPRRVSSNHTSIDEYQIYLRPVVLVGGKPFFVGPTPPLRLVASDRIGEDMIRLTYVPARSLPVARRSGLAHDHEVGDPISARRCADLVQNYQRSRSACNWRT